MAEMVKYSGIDFVVISNILTTQNDFSMGQHSFTICPRLGIFSESIHILLHSSATKYEKKHWTFLALCLHLIVVCYWDQFCYHIYCTTVTYAYWIFQLLILWYFFHVFFFDGHHRLSRHALTETEILHFSHISAFSSYAGHTEHVWHKNENGPHGLFYVRPYVWHDVSSF